MVVLVMIKLIAAFLFFRSVQELYATLSSSPHRMNFLFLFLLVVMACFLVGTVCGRVTKRAHYAKNK